MDSDTEIIFYKHTAQYLHSDGKPFNYKRLTVTTSISDTPLM
jgi:hypothetical protein